mmetsp:Transcript_24607/g.33935  ORF Transcript_24607/g.33935 Transcript_24607/m.33935 type:complete len:81 (+) Transcript_24607:186-428(+)
MHYNNLISDNRIMERNLISTFNNLKRQSSKLTQWHRHNNLIIIRDTILRRLFKALNNILCKPNVIHNKIKTSKTYKINHN